MTANFISRKRPIRLSANEAGCGGLSLKLLVDAPRDQSSTIVALVARKMLNGAYELVYVTDQRIGIGDFTNSARRRLDP